MSSLPSTQDTIVAVATPPGRGGVGIVRITGTHAWTIGERLFQRQTTGTISPRLLAYGKAIDPRTQEPIDDGMIVYFRKPHSYTGEDSVEINAHGSPYLLQRIVEGALALGARAAEPGEMTLRAFLNGRLDLAQAESVIDLIDANTASAARQALAHLDGSLSDQIRQTRMSIIRAIAPIEASIDFPEEEVPSPDRASIATSITQALHMTETLLATAERGRIVREGVRVVLIGRPNVGKSSLFNALLGRDRAIVTPIAGTTRDTIEEQVVLGGTICHLIDTAGLSSNTNDPVEQIGIARTYTALQQAEIAVLVLDQSAALTPMDEQIIAALRTTRQEDNHPPDVIVVLNKSDLPSASPMDDVAAHLALTGEPILTSLITHEGVATLRDRISSVVTTKTSGEADVLVTRARHRDALQQTKVALAQSLQTIDAGLPLDLVAQDLREALYALGAITGETITEDVLTTIFSEFCIGK